MSGTDYFTYTNLIANTLARASDVNSRMAAIQGGFAMLPAPTKIQQGRSTYCVDSGVANTLVVALDFAPASYVAGLSLTVLVAATNTGAATLNINALGAKAIKRYDGSTLAAGDLVVGHIAKFVYDGTNFQLTSPSESVVASYAASATASAATASSAATAASTSATDAAASATAAATSSTNAAASASSATASASGALASYNSTVAALGGYMPLTGGAFSGAVTVQTPTAPTNPATKAYVDAAVFAAGSVSADETTIHSASGVFGIIAQANNTVLGNVSGSSAKPIALTATQLTTLVNAFTTTLSGAVPAPGTSNTTDFLRRDGTWAAPAAAAGTVTTVSVATANGVSGAVATATTTPAITITLGAITPTSVAATGNVTGSNLSGTNTGDQYTSIANNRVLGNVSGASAAAIALTAAQVNNFLGLANIATSGSAADITAGTLAVARGGTGVTTATGTGSVVLGTGPTLSNPVVGTQTAGDNSTKAASTAFVQSALAGYAPAFLGIQSISAAKTLADSDNNDIIFCTGSTARTITASSTPTAGFSCILAFISSVAWTFSCAGGVYTDGATATVTSVSVPAGSRCTAIHKGAGVWLLSGV